ncbi:hypothetical protein COCSADRAFT_217147 [Bipolaris sorokiniana ND90Pr]|uniref:Uncharacterized protein n=1 Tax=Cochliobolus sativus (strain ND90Pr / ATCC 201652) TaxID=665912 RepID=M2TN49_COCSN|nr:uncharacterized protein COCSADRAFT_217147 [Bipolaris sorokiniana ND90Pr]EMD70107.1 hypothetical protein COCSADRAFT_217147 [Bipolaris sorokiniana ND90Pr]
MSERIQPQQCDEQNREYVPSTRSIYYDGRIANALFPPSYPNNDPDTPTWKDGLREIEAFDWLRNDDNEMYNEGEASPLETILTPNPATIVEGCSEYGKTSSLPYGYALSDPTPALDHLSSETATTRVPEVFKPYKPVPSCTSPPGILEPTPIYEPTNPVHGLRPYLSAQSYSSTPVCPSTPPYQNPYTDPVVQTPQNVQAPRSLEYLQSMRYSPPLVTIRERKVPGDEVLVEMLYNTVVFDSSPSSIPTPKNPNKSQEYFNNMKIREPGNISPTVPLVPTPKKESKVQIC